MVDKDRPLSRRGLLRGVTAAAVLSAAAASGAAPAAAAVSTDGTAALTHPTTGGHRVRNRRGLKQLGVVYDTGFFSIGRDKPSTHEPFVPHVVKRDMKAIADDLACTHVRITGGDPDRLQIAAEKAVAAGLGVWYSPFTVDLEQDELAELLVDSARRAERLRKRGADVTFVVGGELSLTNIGFLPGATIFDRLAFLEERGPEFIPAIVALPGKINAFFTQLVPRIRRAFRGPITYASIEALERPDWSIFDIMSVDTYRDASAESTFPAAIADFVERGETAGKPVAITESGCATYRGAAARGGRADTIVVYDRSTNTAVSMSEQVERDEAEQAETNEELFTIYDDAGVHAAFVNMFAMRHLPRDKRNPDRDFDRAGFGIVSVLRDGRGWRGHPWEPKATYFAIGALFRRLRRH